jgi:hypothetical protein
MQDFKNKLYNYETPPPGEIWRNIEKELQISNEPEDEKVVNISTHRRSAFLFYGATAAASVVIIFLGSLFFNKNKHLNPTANTPANSNNVLAQKIKDSINLNHKILESIIHNPKEKKEIIAKNQNQKNSKKYLTVANPEGQPVKISPKVATLIISADNGFPPKPVWNKKISKWQKIMLSSTVSPISANLIDLVKLAAKNDNDNLE